MNSIYYSYFISKGIFLLMVIIIGYAILKNGLPKWSFILFLLITIFLTFFTFSGPTIFENISIYEKLENLKTENVEEINIFDISFTENNNEPIPNSLYTLESKKEIEFIVNTLKRNEFYNQNFGGIEKFYGLNITLKDKSEINFKIIKSKENAYPELLIKKNGKYFTIGTYKNNSISEILLE
jgi:hypothetical protein